MVALTSIVTMDKETWSHDVTPLDMNVFEKQLETAISIGLDAIKTGMLGTQGIIKRAGEVYEESGADYFVVDQSWFVKVKTKYLTQEILTQ